MASCDSQSKNSCEIRTRLDTLDGRVELFESFKQRLEQRLEELQVKSWKKAENGNLFKKHCGSCTIVVVVLSLLKIIFVDIWSICRRCRHVINSLISMVDLVGVLLVC